MQPIPWIGEWLEGRRNGLGLLVLPSGNRYEGMWQDDLKHGDGQFFYLDKVSAETRGVTIKSL